MNPETLFLVVSAFAFGAALGLHGYAKAQNHAYARYIAAHQRARIAYADDTH